jgi:Spy/CpxP family protein refolding chaperone
MRHALWFLLIAAMPLQAQAPGDTGDVPPVQMQRLRQMVIERWRARVRADLNLTDDQATKLHATEDRFAARRRDVSQRQAQVLLALRSQLQPGVAANADTVRRLMDEREKNRTALAGLERDEDGEIASYLTPVQHARYQLLRQQLQDRIAEMRRERRQRMWRGRAAP